MLDLLKSLFDAVAAIFSRKDKSNEAPEKQYEIFTEITAERLASTEEIAQLYEAKLMELQTERVSRESAFIELKAESTRLEKDIQAKDNIISRLQKMIAQCADEKEQLEKKLKNK